jgi:uncharacterized glyoxalase superfamily protein PhnB
VRQRVAGLPRPDSEGDGTLPRRGSSGVGHSIATIPREEVWFRIDSPAEGRLQWRQKQVPEGYPNVTPYLCVDGATAAIEFYGKVFGATERMRMPAPEGKIRHSELQIGDSLVMLSDEFPEMGVRGPKSVGATSVTLSVYVEDVDASTKRWRRAPRSSARSRTNSTATGLVCSRIRSGTGGASPPTSRTCRRTRWPSARPRWEAELQHARRPRPAARRGGRHGSDVVG